MNNALRWRVDRPGGGTAYLTGGQRALLWVIRKQSHRGPTTLTALTRLTGGSSRGRTWHQMARLRQLGLIGCRAWGPRGAPRTPGRSPGRYGRLLVWLPARARAAWRGRWRAGRAVANDSLSTPFGGFITREGVAAAWTGGTPRLAAGPPRLVGPRRGHPPRVLHVRCPAGHRTMIGRTTSRQDAAGLSASWFGHCRRCRAPIVERIELRLPVVPRRPSPDELADPAILEGRRRSAAELVASGTLPASVREQLTRDYLTDPPGPSLEGGPFHRAR